MRTKYALKNIYIGLVTQVVIIILGFVSRKVFIDSLGTEYLGVNGVLTNVLSMMILIESGIGISIVYNLYKPLADGNKDKICALIKLYKKAYRVLALIMLILSCMIYPLLDSLIITDMPIKAMGLVYAIFVSKNIISYLNAYKWALINADQKEYVLAKNNLYFQIVTTIGKIIILEVTSSYILFLSIELIIFAIQNIVNTIVIKRRYPYINDKRNYTLDIESKKNINKNVKAMFFHNIGAYLVCSTDNILISACISVKAVGLYSNYTMIISQLTALLNPVIGGIGAGIGNLIATESKDKVYDIFKTSFFVSFWIYSIATIFLYNLLEPFINWWIGYGFLLDKFVFLVILLNFYVGGMRGVIITFKSKAGLFVQDKYAPVLEGIINLVFSLVLVKYFGLLGIFLGTTLSTLLVPFWNQARIVYKSLFKISLSNFFISYTKYFCMMMISGIVTTYLCNSLVDGGSFISLIIRGIICTIVPNLIYITLFYKTDEFQYLYTIGKGMIGDKFKTRIGRVN
ncbi:MAG: hypothetical protein RSF37_10695 [Clostridium sp.]|uniref:lipopolysaccharide biosynthesis protein n=1 Tax=Clostridium sp. TaxID=1506 RepID=UPI002FC678E6